MCSCVFFFVKKRFEGKVYSYKGLIKSLSGLFYRWVSAAAEVSCCRAQVSCCLQRSPLICIKTINDSYIFLLTVFSPDCCLETPLCSWMKRTFQTIAGQPPCLIRCQVGSPPDTHLMRRLVPVILFVPAAFSRLNAPHQPGRSSSNTSEHLCSLSSCEEKRTEFRSKHSFSTETAHWNLIYILTVEDSVCIFWLNFQKLAKILHPPKPLQADPPALIRFAKIAKFWLWLV